MHFDIYVTTKFLKTIKQDFNKFFVFLKICYYPESYLNLAVQFIN